MRNEDKVDLRSDTVTKPTPAMLEAMVQAEVGDDVHHDDPTVDALQKRVAEEFGKERALFTPSGAMANLLAIRSHTEPGDEIIAHRYTHVFQYEAGSYAAVAGCSIHLIDGPRGQFDANDVERAVRPVDAHFPRSRLLVVENTQNKGGGSVWPMERIESVVNAARRHGMRCHLDGARLMNACVASGHKPADYARHFDTISMCFSKGLGAPVGSILAGSEDTIARAYRFRTMFGGAMRQSGYLAACALYALEHHVERLAEDHANARRIAETLAECPGIDLNLDDVETNIIVFNVNPKRGSAGEIAHELEEAGVRTFAIGSQQVRAVTHLNAAGNQNDRAIEIIRTTLGGR